MTSLGLSKDTYMNQHAIRMIVTLLLASSLSACGGAAPIDPLSVAASGVSTALVLNKMQEIINTALQQAISGASLVESKTARDAELLVDAARAALSEELNKNWDRLDTDKISLLR